MKQQRIGSLGGLLLAAATATAGGGAHWGYSGHEGPGHWGELSPEYSACAEGKNQSPINLRAFAEAELAPIEFRYAGQATEILNNGHTVQANYSGGSSIVVDGQEFELKQFHFHAPSENQINGESFPMEAHLVHADADGNLAVVAVMFEAGASNAAIAKLWKDMPEHAGDKNALGAKVGAAELLPADRDYYRFNGSLTTPPCTEGVRWLVMKQPVSLSEGQVEAFAHVLHHPNNRPVQAVNARSILK